MTPQQQTNQINQRIRQTQNIRLCEQAKEIKQLRERNRKLGDMVWQFFLEAKMWKGLLGRKDGR